jgi:hypothetical protein
MRKTKERLMHLQPEPGFRESYRIEGETVITVQDYTSGRLFDDAICYAFYPVDLHTKNGVKPVPLKPGTFPTIPLSALIPKDSRNIIVAGRCVSSDRLANSGLRVQAPCMAMGQAAACAAAAFSAAAAASLAAACVCSAALSTLGAAGFSSFVAPPSAGKSTSKVVVVP